MTDTAPSLTDTIRHAQARADAAIAFCTAQDFPLGAALIAHRWRGGPAEAVIATLARYQNADGGFGNGLEVDIAAPDSNPFATRIAMQAIIALDPRPATAAAMLAGIDRYLAVAHDAGGDFRLTPAVLSGEIAPWFAGWTYPNLNPALCLAGLAAPLGIGNPDLFQRVGGMVAAIGNPEIARNGGFYDVLPYAEGAFLLDANGHEDLLAATAEGIIRQLEHGDFEDASHALDLALGGGEVLAARIPTDLIAREAARLIAEQEDDGGWPSPYGAAWRPWITAMAFVQLATLRDTPREG
ncbi:MAG TPA: hypothetical protein VNP95_02340 [Thermomicrobiales bacterium]|nr:hypothetical protein [Thermomicrobiales bacterium]